MGDVEEIVEGWRRLSVTDNTPRTIFGPVKTIISRNIGPIDYTTQDLGFCLHMFVVFLKGDRVEYWSINLLTLHCKQPSFALPAQLAAHLHHHFFPFFLQQIPPIKRKVASFIHTSFAGSDKKTLENN